MSEDEYRALKPGYDPGTFFDGVTDKDQLRRLLLVDQKIEALKLYLRMVNMNCARQVNFLDVGCGLGGYLIAAEEMGFQAMGIEPSEDHSQIGRDIGKLNIVNGYFDKATLGAQKFDVIMLSHVIEHIYNPRLFIESLCKCLADEGVLVIITPNSSSIIARMTGASWPMLRPVDHVSMISKDTFSVMGVKATFATSEYLWEFAATLASILRTSANSALRVKRGPVVNPKVESWRPSLSMRRNFPVQIAKIAFAVISAPFYLIARMLDRRACLIAMVRR